MLEKERVLASLKEAAKQYGLSAELLESIAGNALIEDEDGLSSWIESQRPIMLAMQRSLDSARGSAKRVEDNKTVVGGQISAEDVEKLIEAKVAAIDERYKQKITDLEQELSDGKARAAESEFKDKVKRIGISIGLREDVLDLLIPSFRVGMSDEDIKSSLSEKKAVLNKAGLPEDDIPNRVTDKEELRKDAKDWVDKMLGAKS